MIKNPSPHKQNQTHRNRQNISIKQIFPEKQKKAQNEKSSNHRSKSHKTQEKEKETYTKEPFKSEPLWTDNLDAENLVKKSEEGRKATKDLEEREDRGLTEEDRVGEEMEVDSLEMEAMRGSDQRKSRQGEEEDGWWNGEMLLVGLLKERKTRYKRWKGRTMCLSSCNKDSNYWPKMIQTSNNEKSKLNLSDSYTIRGDAISYYFNRWKNKEGIKIKKEDEMSISDMNWIGRVVWVWPKAAALLRFLLWRPVGANQPPP